MSADDELLRLLALHPDTVFLLDKMVIDTTVSIPMSKRVVQVQYELMAKGCYHVTKNVVVTLLHGSEDDQRLARRLQNIVASEKPRFM